MIGRDALADPGDGHSDQQSVHVSGTVDAAWSRAADSSASARHRGIYVVEGVVNFHVDGGKVRAEAGTLIHLPRMVPHTFTVASEETRVINFLPAGDGAGMPPRNLDADEVIYVLEGAVTVESDGQSIGGGIGSLTYMPGSIVSWRAAGKARLLIFHSPGGFDRALAGGCGQDGLVVAWLESIGTRFLTKILLTPATLNSPGGR